MVMGQFEILRHLFLDTVRRLLGNTRRGYKLFSVVDKSMADMVDYYPFDIVGIFFSRDFYSTAA